MTQGNNQNNQVANQAANQASQANKPASLQATTPKKKLWADMTKDEREAEKVLRKAAAISAVKTGEFPGGVRVKIGEHTLTLKPSGVSEKGSVAYSIAPSIIEVGGKQVRINKISLSVLNQGGGMEELEGLEDLTII